MPVSTDRVVHAALAGNMLVAATKFIAAWWTGVLAAAGPMVARETKGLLIGERASRRIEPSIMQIAGEEQGVERVNGLLTFHLGAQHVVATLSLEFADRHTAPEIETIVHLLEQHIRAAQPEVIALFVKPQTAKTYEKLLRQRYGAADAA